MLERLPLALPTCVHETPASSVRMIEPGEAPVPTAKHVRSEVQSRSLPEFGTEVRRVKLLPPSAVDRTRLPARSKSPFFSLGNENALSVAAQPWSRAVNGSRT